MDQTRCVIVGGGHAGLHAAKVLSRTLENRGSTRAAEIVVVDAQPWHVRKVLLFAEATRGVDVTRPWNGVLPHGVRFIRGTVTHVDGAQRIIAYTGDGGEVRMAYDVAVIAVGSVVRDPSRQRGGMALTGPDAARTIGGRWRDNVVAAQSARGDERRRLLSVAVVGAGITGVETAAELAVAMRAEAARLQLDETVTIYLLNRGERLFKEAPPRVAQRLERLLQNRGVTVLHGCTAIEERNGQLVVAGLEPLSVGLCVWTMGLMANPDLQEIGLPLTTDGRIVVDASYRVVGASGTYSIGDCARIVDPVTGREDRMTCKEAIAQAMRLGRIVAADLRARRAPQHRGVVDFFSVGLGPGQGLTWTRVGPVNLVVGGWFAWWVKTWAWAYASLTRSTVDSRGGMTHKR